MSRPFTGIVSNSGRGRKMSTPLSPGLSTEPSEGKCADETTLKEYGVTSTGRNVRYLVLC